jgi:hypothetical protein
VTPDELDIVRLGWSRVDPLTLRYCDVCARRAFWVHGVPDPDLHLCTAHLCKWPEVRALDENKSSPTT